MVTIAGHPGRAFFSMGACLMLMTASHVAAQDVSAERLRPRPDLLLRCEEAPSEAVTRPPPAVARWATVYCTKAGHLFTFRDGYFGNMVGEPFPFLVRAASVKGASDLPGNTAFFTRFDYRPLPASEVPSLKVQNPLLDNAVSESKPLYLLGLSTNSGQNVNLIVADPESDPFFLFPVTSNGSVSRFAYAITSLGKLNAFRQSHLAPK